MGGLSANVYKGLRRYWKRRSYQRLHRRHNPAQTDPAQTGSARGRKRFKISPRIRILRRIGSPKKWLTRLRDAYVKMMLKLANSGLVGSGFGGSVEYGYGFGNRPVKEYDEKMIVEIYKSLMMTQGQLMPSHVGKISSNQISSAW